MSDPKGRDQAPYRRLRRRVIVEQPLCACGCGRAVHEVDHVVPLSKGGALMDRSNLQGLSRQCHARKTKRDRMTGARAEWAAAVDELASRS
ncbi:MAG: HNH endonuclease signature motif containing protein [Acidobacteria bacterium]|nr:HNH endonuclease signature motif containing protein [Acidobacteriota bacterium]